MVLMLVMASVSLGYTADNFFVSLDKNVADLTSGYAEFTLKNPTAISVTVDTSKLNFNIRLNNTPTLKTNIFLLKNVSSIVPNFVYKLVNKTCIDGNGTTIDCSYNEQVQNGTNTVWKTTWVPLGGSETFTAGKTYKFRVEANWLIPKMINGTVSKAVRDWVPYISAAGITYNQTNWAWWNSSYWYCKNLTFDTKGYNYNMTLVDRNIDTSTWDTKPYNGSIRLTNNSCGAFNSGDIEYPTDIWNYTLDGGNKYASFNLLTLLNRSAGINENGKFSVYYSNSPTNYASYSGITYSQGVSSNSPLNITTGRATFYYNISGAGSYVLKMDYDGQTVCDEGNYQNSCLFQVDNVLGSGNPGGSGNGKQYSVFNGSICHIGIRYTTDYPITTYNSTFYLCLGDQAYMFDGNSSTYHQYSQHPGSPQYQGGANTIFQYGIEGSNYTLPYMTNDYHTGGYMSIKTNTINQIYAAFVTRYNGSHNNGQYLGDPAFFIDDSDGYQYVPFWYARYYPNTTGLLPVLNFGKETWWALYSPATYSLGNEEIMVPSIIPVYPNSGATNSTNNIYFGYISNYTNGYPLSCGLYLNESGIWTKVMDNQTAVINNSINQFYWEFKNAGQYTWGIKCSITGNSSIGQTESTNRTLTLTDHTPGYVASGYEVTSYPFNLSLTFSNYTYSNVKLVYNNTVYAATNSSPSFWYASLITPLLQANNSNVSFYWNYTRTNSTGSYTITTQSYTQQLFYAYVPASAGFNISAIQEGQTILSYLTFWNQSSLATVTTAWFYEDGTQYYGTMGASGGVINSSRSWRPKSPTSPIESRNYTWSATVYYGGQTRTMTLVTGNISIYKLTVTGCGDGNLTALVYTAWDEKTWENLPSADYKVTVKVYNGLTSQTYSFTANNSNNISICIYPSYATYSADITLLYSVNNTYPQRTWYDFGTQLTNQTVTKAVYLLNYSEAFITTLKTYGSTLGITTDVWLLIQKWNYSSNSFVNMTSLFTAGYGEAFTYLNRYDTPYKIILMGTDGSVLNTYTDMFVTTSPLYLLTTITTLSTFEKLTTISADCSLDNSTMLVSCTYNDPLEYLTNISLSVWEAKYYGFQTLCTDTQTAHSGTLNCDLSLSNSSTGYVIYVIANVDNVDWVLYHTSTKGALPVGFGTDGLFYALMLVVTLFFVGAFFGPTPAILGVLLGTIISLWTDFILVGDGTTKSAMTGIMIIIAVVLIWRGTD